MKMRPLYTALLATAVVGAMVPIVRKLRQRNGARSRDTQRLDHDRTREDRAPYPERRKTATTPIGTAHTAPTAPTSASL
jgi:hypothetical protein